MCRAGKARARRGTEPLPRDIVKLFVNTAIGQTAKLASSRNKSSRPTPRPHLSVPTISAVSICATVLKGDSLCRIDPFAHELSGCYPASGSDNYQGCSVTLPPRAPVPAISAVSICVTVLKGLTMPQEGSLQSLPHHGANPLVPRTFCLSSGMRRR